LENRGTRDTTLSYTLARTGTEVVMSNKAAQAEVVKLLAEVADLADQGLTAPQIADELGAPLELVGSLLYGPGDLLYGSNYEAL